MPKRQRMEPEPSELYESTVGRLGQGWNGSVFAVKRLEDGRVCAVKVQPVTLYDVERLRAELDVSGTVHENIIRMHRSFVCDGLLYIEMEYAMYGTLTRACDEASRLPRSEAAAFVAAVARPMLSAVEHLHSIGILHNDIKTDNVLICRGYAIKLADFSISKRTEEDKSEDIRRLADALASVKIKDDADLAAALSEMAGKTRPSAEALKAWLLTQPADFDFGAMLTELNVPFDTDIRAMTGMYYITRRPNIVL